MIWINSVQLDAANTLHLLVALLRCTTQHSSVCVASSTTVAGRVAGAVPSGLWQRHACRSTRKPARQTAVGDECRSTACLLCMKVRAHNAATLRLHWMPVRERIEFKLAVLMFRCLHGTVLPYLANELCRVADIDARRRLRSASTSALVTPSSRRSTIGDRAFFVAALRVWNCLPSSITASQTLGTFRRRLKTHLFAVSLT